MTNQSSGEMTMDEFAGHDPTAGGSREFLKWKDDGEIKVWLVSQPYKLWRNSFSRVVRYKEQKSGSEKEVIRMFNWVTMEPGGKDDKHLGRIKKQGYYYDADPSDFDERVEIEVDPFLMLLEWVFRAIVTKKIDWLDEIFRFEAEDTKEDRVYHAGGLCRMYPRKFDDLEFEGTKAEQEEAKTDLKRKFKKAGVDITESYVESAVLDLKYAFAIIDDDAPEEGAKISIEAKTIGDAVKKIYRDRLRSATDGERTEEQIREKANVILSRKKPGIAFLWTYDEDADFKDRYDVSVLDELRPSEEVLEVLDGELPDIAREAAPCNVALLEQTFRKHWVHKVVPPWEEIFAKAYEVVKGTELAELPEEFGFGANARDRKSISDPKGKESKEEDSTEVCEAPRSKGALFCEEDEEEDVEMVECEACGASMPTTAMECPHCHADYVSVRNEAGEDFVVLRSQKCTECGKGWLADELVCRHCEATYQVKGEEFVATPKPKSEEKKDEVKAPRRRSAAAKV